MRDLILETIYTHHSFHDSAQTTTISFLYEENQAGEITDLNGRTLFKESNIDRIDFSPDGTQAIIYYESEFYENVKILNLEEL